MQLLTLPGVFRPISDSWMLADRVADRSAPDRRVLDLCTGSGVVALAAAGQGAEVTAVDVSRRAVATVRLNARLRRHRVRAARGRLFEPVVGQRFDVIASNPPYVPAPHDDLPTRGPSRAWVAGRDGRAVLDQICDKAAEHLLPAGVVLLVHSSLIGEDETIRRLERSGLTEVRVVERRTGPLGPLMRGQQALGTISADIDEEDLVVVQASMPSV